MSSMEQILVIDDDRAICEFISKTLSHVGYQVKVAYDGGEGIGLLEDCTQFKAVITDIRMPKKDGNEVAKYIRNSYKSKDIPVLAITGYSDEADRELFTCIFEKPFKMKDLLEMINSFQ